MRVLFRLQSNIPYKLLHVYYSNGSWKLWKILSWKSFQKRKWKKSWFFDSQLLLNQMIQKVESGSVSNRHQYIMIMHAPKCIVWCHGDREFVCERVWVIVWGREKERERANVSSWKKERVCTWSCVCVRLLRVYVWVCVHECEYGWVFMCESGRERLSREGEREIILSEHMWMNSIDDNSAAVGVPEGVSLAALNFLNGRKRLNLILT